MRRFSFRRVFALAFSIPILTSACAQERPIPPTSEETSSSLAVSAKDSPYVVHSAFARAGDREILDVARDGRMFIGRSVPVPPRSSARQTFEAVLLTSTGHEGPIPFTTHVQDVRFAHPPSPLVAVLDDRDVLTVWDTHTGATHRIDDQVFPGFGFSHDGKAMVYSKGLTPELEAFRVSLPDGRPSQLTFGGVPVWGFAFSPDDRHIVYVDAPDGFPCLVIMPAEGGERKRLTNRTLSPSDLRAGKTLAPIPDGRRPPLWVGSTIYVEDTTGVHGLDLFGNILFHEPGARDLHLGLSGSVMARRGSVVSKVER